MVLGTTRVVMGVTLGDPGMGGIKLYEVTANGAAEQAGLKAGDVILTIDGRPTQTDTAFRDSLSNKQPGDRVDVAYSRDGKQLDTKVFVVPETVEPKGGRPEAAVGAAGTTAFRARGASRPTSSRSSASNTRT